MFSTHKQLIWKEVILWLKLKRWHLLPVQTGVWALKWPKNWQKRPARHYWCTYRRKRWGRCKKINWQGLERGFCSTRRDWPAIRNWCRPNIEEALWSTVHPDQQCWCRFRWSQSTFNRWCQAVTRWFRCELLWTHWCDAKKMLPLLKQAPTAKIINMSSMMGSKTEALTRILTFIMPWLLAINPRKPLPTCIPCNWLRNLRTLSYQSLSTP